LLLRPREKCRIRSSKARAKVLSSQNDGATLLGVMAKRRAAAKQWMKDVERFRAGTEALP
jgi:hypothetical protein